MIFHQNTLARLKNLRDYDYLFSTCNNRKAAFLEAGIEDKTPYLYDQKKL